MRKAEWKDLVCPVSGLQLRPAVATCWLWSRSVKTALYNKVCFYGAVNSLHSENTNNCSLMEVLRSNSWVSSLVKLTIYPTISTDLCDSYYYYFYEHFCGFISIIMFSFIKIIFMWLINQIWIKIPLMQEHPPLPFGHINTLWSMGG